MKNNISAVDKVKKQRTITTNYLSNKLNKKVDSILQKSFLLDKSKNKDRLNDEWDDNKEYYENFLIKLKAERQESNALCKTNIKVERKKKSKTLKLSEDEKKKVKTTLNNNRRKSMFHSYLRKSLIQKKNKEIENIKQEKLEPIIEKPSLIMSNNIQFFIQETKKNNKINLKEEEDNNNNNINNNNNCNNNTNNNNNCNNNNNNNLNNNNKNYFSVVDIENIFEKEFGKIEKKNNKFSTFCNFELDNKKRKEIQKGIIEKLIIPVEQNFISNATKIEFKKNSDMGLTNNSIDKHINTDKNITIKNIPEENDIKKNENLIEANTNGINENIFIYTIKDDSHKKKKFTFCCCLPIKF